MPLSCILSTSTSVDEKLPKSSCKYVLELLSRPRSEKCIGNLMQPGMHADANLKVTYDENTNKVQRT